jgi:hypothetical protein
MVVLASLEICRLSEVSRQREEGREGVPRGGVLRELELTLEDLLIHSLDVGVIEGRQAPQHLIQEGAQTPPVHRLAMPFVLQDLRGKVLWGATEGLGASLWSSAGDAALGETKVSEADVALSIEQQILRLEVSVDDIIGVESLQSRGDLSGVEATTLFRESSIFLQPEEELSSGHVVEHHVPEDEGQ